MDTLGSSHISNTILENFLFLGPPDLVLAPELQLEFRVSPRSMEGRLLSESPLTVREGASWLD
jgi:hypothetical protein